MQIQFKWFIASLGFALIAIAFTFHGILAIAIGYWAGKSFVFKLFVFVVQIVSKIVSLSKWSSVCRNSLDKNWISIFLEKTKLSHYFQTSCAEFAKMILTIFRRKKFRKLCLRMSTFPTVFFLKTIQN